MRGAPRQEPVPGYSFMWVILDVPLEENDVVSLVRRGGRRIPWRALLRFPHGQDATYSAARDRDPRITSFSNQWPLEVFGRLGASVPETSE